jgi:hypothetical protein
VETVGAQSRDPPEAIFAVGVEGSDLPDDDLRRRMGGSEMDIDLTHDLQVVGEIPDRLMRRRIFRWIAESVVIGVCVVR